jgi:TRAP-type C4-dicarboxylate transport system permease large subunit
MLPPYKAAVPALLVLPINRSTPPVGSVVWVVVEVNQDEVAMLLLLLLLVLLLPTEKKSNRGRVLAVSYPS